jgi:hypothetical protein
MRTEQSRESQGYKDYDVVLINLSIMGTLVLRWLKDKGNGVPSTPHNYELNAPLANAVDGALSVAHNYSTFLNTFPMWHQNRLFAELVGDSRIRFTVPGGIPAKRVSAYQKGFRPRAALTNKGAHADGLELDAEQTRERNIALSRCFHSGYLKMTYPEPLDLYESLFPPYLDRMNALFRRDDAIDLGPYTIGELKLGYAALTTICSVHEDLSFRFGRSHQYPINSCVMMRTPEVWSNLISKLSGLDIPKSLAIVGDLTLGSRYWDLHVHPFVPVDNDQLAAAPQFPLHTRADETLLRICGHLRPSYFSMAALQK